jgi:catechol 2,3-dioxygenase
MSTQPSTTPSAGASVSHLVLNVRDIEASHRFYTELLGFVQCGDLSHTMTMRFYRGNESHHHDLALVQVNDPAGAEDPERWSMEPRRVGVNHVAIAYPDRESWLNELRHLRANDVEFLVRGNHGMSHSAYIADPDGYGIEVLYNLPEEVWGPDVDAALNYFEYLPPEQELEDTTDYQRFGEDAPPPVGVPGRVKTRQS